MKKNWKKKLHSLMMMEPKCTVAWLIACWPVRVDSQSHESLMSRSDNQSTRQQNLSELEICLILVGKLFHKDGN